jgi:hypothetical protein
MRRIFSFIGIAARNALKHRRLSLVLLVVFMFTGAALYWSIGFGNAVERLVSDAYFDSYGDFALLTEPFDTAGVRSLVEDPAFASVEFERELRGMYVTPKRSDIAAIVELTPGNELRLGRWLKPVAGRLPRGPEEVMVPEVFLEGAFAIGDKIYLVTTTKDRIINTIRYTVVGICKSVSVKGFPTAFLISQESMESLYDAAGVANLVTVRMKPERRAETKAFYEGVGAKLEKAGIAVRSSWTLAEQLSRFTLYTGILTSLKNLILVILFPFTGSITAVIVWFNSYKRRQEIWTYVALGLRDAGIYAVFSLEYYLVAAMGLATGIILGAAGSLLTFRLNIWIQFSYTFISPVVTAFGCGDLAFVLAFSFAMLTVWIYPPLSRIVGQRPFSY